MSNFKSIFENFLNGKGIDYFEHDETTLVVPFPGKNLNAVSVVVNFDDDGTPFARLASYAIGRVGNDDRDRLAALSLCNKLNENSRLVKYYMDSEGDICAQIDTYFDENTCGAICYLMVNLLNMRVDENYPYFVPVLSESAS